MFHCTSCGRKFLTEEGAKRAANAGCPSCGSLAIGLTPEATRTAWVLISISPSGRTDIDCFPDKERAENHSNILATMGWMPVAVEITDQQLIQSYEDLRSWYEARKDGGR